MGVKMARVVAPLVLKAFARGSRRISRMHCYVGREELTYLQTRSDIDSIAYKIIIRFSNIMEVDNFLMAYLSKPHRENLSYRNPLLFLYELARVASLYGQIFRDTGSDFDIELEGHCLDSVYSLEVSHKFLRALVRDNPRLPREVTLHLIH